MAIEIRKRKKGTIERGLQKGNKIITLKRKITLEGRFLHHLPEQKSWQLQCNNGRCYNVGNPKKVPNDLSPDFKVHAAFNPHKRSTIKVVRTQPIVEEDELPDFGMAF